MNWKDPKVELPKDNDVVAILIFHCKNHWPLSVEIYFGTARKYDNLPEDTGQIVVENIDMIGSGCQRWTFGLPYPDSDSIMAWCAAKEFQKPEFLNHNDHWGMPFSPC